jgi:tetratricopeptide (TPR) repeat protein
MSAPRLILATALALWGLLAENAPPAVAETAFTPVTETVDLTPQPDGAEIYAHARAAAWLAALRKASGLLLGQRELLIGDISSEDRLALAAQLYTADVWSLAGPNQSLRLTVTLHPKPETGLLLARTLRNPEARLLRRGLLDEVSAVLEAAGEAGGRVSAEKLLDGLWLVQNAMELTAEGWYVEPQALSDMESAVGLAPQNALAHLLLGEARLRSDLPQQCAQACDEALRLDPSLRRARYIRALAHWRLQQFALAEDDLNASLADAPPGEERIQRLQARGAVRMLRGKYDGMCEDYMAACSLGDCDGLKTLREQGYCKAESAR